MLFSNTKEVFDKKMGRNTPVRPSVSNSGSCPHFTTTTTYGGFSPLPVRDTVVSVLLCIVDYFAFHSYKRLSMHFTRSQQYGPYFQSSARDQVVPS